MCPVLLQTADGLDVSKVLVEVISLTELVTMWSKALPILFGTLTLVGSLASKILEDQIFFKEEAPLGGGGGGFCLGGFDGN